MSWVIAELRLPKDGQWVVILWGDGFKCGVYEKKHPFAPAVVDRHSGRYYTGFDYWRPLSFPKGTKP